jgi:hypothetical protein
MAVAPCRYLQIHDQQGEVGLTCRAELGLDTEMNLQVSLLEPTPLRAWQNARGWAFPEFRRAHEARRPVLLHRTLAPQLALSLVRSMHQSRARLA